MLAHVPNASGFVAERGLEGGRTPLASSLSEAWRESLTPFDSSLRDSRMDVASSFTDLVIRRTYGRTSLSRVSRKVRLVGAMAIEPTPYGRVAPGFACYGGTGPAATAGPGWGREQAEMMNQERGVGDDDTMPLYVHMLSHDPTQGHRGSSPLELFFDLTFVVAVAQAGSAFQRGSRK